MMSGSDSGPVSKRSRVHKLWVPVILLIGLITGELISEVTVRQPPRFGGGGGPLGYFRPFPTSPLFGYHVVLTTIEVALLISLVAVYCRMYIETRANFALGLVIVLSALLLQALLSYPITDDLVEIVTLPGAGYTTFAADIVTVAAYTVFLYLSLE